MEGPPCPARLVGLPRRWYPPASVLDPPTSSPAPDGQVIAGKYRLVEKLGQGGMGSVWLAEHLVLGSRVAVKVIDNDDTEKNQSGAVVLECIS